ITFRCLDSRLRGGYILPPLRGGYVKFTPPRQRASAHGADMEQRIEAFLHYMSAERGASKNTIDAYRNDLTRFAEFCNNGASSNGARADVLNIDRDVITNYILWLRNKNEYAPATVARKVAAVKSFCAFLLDHGDITSNPTASIDSPRAPKPVPR